MGTPGRKPVMLLNYRSLGLLAPWALIVPIMLFLVACGGGDTGLSRAEVEEIVRAEMDEAPATAQPQPGLTSAEVEEAILKAMADMPEPDLGLSKSEVAEIVKAALAEHLSAGESGLTSAEAETDSPRRGGLHPAQIGAPAEYTKFFVNNAINRYETQGLDATLAYYNREESV